MAHLDGEHVALKSFTIVSSATIPCRLQTARAKQSLTVALMTAAKSRTDGYTFRGVQLDDISNFLRRLNDG
jgi:hypothetical protein